jgi:cobalamin biosynthesis Mg chelatase CobN
MRIACWLVRLASIVLGACGHAPEIKRAVDVKEVATWTEKTEEKTSATTVVEAKRDRRVVREKLRTDGTPYERTTVVDGEVSTSTTDESGSVTSDGNGKAEVAVKVVAQNKPAKRSWPWWAWVATAAVVSGLAGSAGLLIARRLLR